MSDAIYRPLIEDMVWSYSRLSSFDSCKWQWFLHYIRHKKEDEMFYSSYGKFVHKILERFYRGEITKDEMMPEFLSGFSTEVEGRRPAESTVRKYLDGACEYFASFEKFPFEMVDVEHEVNFELGGKKFVGYIDYLGKENGEFVIVDNKSGDIRPRSNRAVPTKKDKELDKKLVQLYLYSAAVEQEFGKLPKALCFNCFRTGQFIREPFDIDKYHEAIEWATNKIEEIASEEDFDPTLDMFYCNWICGFNQQCEPFEEDYLDWKANH